MGNFKQTSNVSVTITQEYKSRTEVNNEEAHTKQIVLSGHARKEYKKYNYAFDTSYSDKRYKDIIWKNLKTGTKYDKSTLKDDEFWVGRIYKKKNCGKTTTYMESMTFAPPWRIHPDEIDTFLRSPENQYFEDIKDFLLSEEQFKGVMFLGFHVHMDEVYVPESITLEDGTEYILEESERWNYAYIKPHMTVDYIPTVLAQDKEGNTYRQLSRTKLWKSKEGRYNQSYAEFNTRKYEAVDKNYDLERGELYDNRKPEERPIKRTLEEYQKANDMDRVKRLIKQQQTENKKAVDVIEQEAESIIKKQGMIKEAQKELEQNIEDYVEDIKERYNINNYQVDEMLLKEEKALLIDTLKKVAVIIKPLKQIVPEIHKKLMGLLENVMERLQTDNMYRSVMNKYNRNEER